jgi:hypothetical protein
MMLMADSACVCDPPESWICGPPESCICGPAEPPSSSLGVFVPVLLLVLVLVAVPVVLGTLFFVDMFKSFCCVERPTHVRRRRSRPFELGGPIASDASRRPRSPVDSAAFLFRECAHPGWARRASDGLAASIRLILAQLRPFAKRNKQAVKPRAAQAASYA